MENFAVRGVGVVRQLVDAPWLARAMPILDDLLDWPHSPRPGARRAIDRRPELIDLIRAGPVQTLMESLCGPDVMVIRSIAFDKTPDSNWAVAWHQDATIAVRERIELPHFGPWSIKAGEHHCQPPRELLDRIITLRIHLDPCAADNGPLRVIPGSHMDGLVSDDQVDHIAASTPFEELHAAPGDAVVMHPHVVHSSPRAINPGRRRVLHLDCTSAALPGGLQWAESFALSRAAAIQ